MKLEIDVPEDAFASLRQTPTQFATKLRLAACIKWYELGRITQSKAAEITGLSRADFIDVLRDYRVPAIQADPDDLAREMAL